MTTCVASTALLVASAGLAQAYDPDAPATEVAEAIAAVAPEAGAVLEAASAGDGFEAQVGEATVVVPEDASTPVSLTSTDPAGPDLTVALPDLAGADTVRQADDGTLVYTSDDDASLAVQPLADGSTRFLSVLENENAPERYDYTFEGFDLALQEDGSVLVLDGEEPVGMLAAPWATDAEGVSVPTRYEVEGSTLTQVVDHASGGFGYPVTADPWITFGRGTYLNMQGWELKTMATALFALGGGAVVVTCSGLSKLPHGAAKIAQLLCTLTGGVTGMQLWDLIVKTWRTKSIKNLGCYQARVLITPYAVVPYTPFYEVKQRRNCGW
ncbi:hypothetical protein [Sanguibacter massiliensis]|uniref:hypothetical protein n=1 Tax=Sanguibacter massiliensis TaxID=1973217 RepID=UPI000C8373CF|nr:hypothetical protein [Sanguibacter massiliensis]